MLVIWEMTQACDLNCAHCRANSRPHRHPLELSTAEAFHLIDQIADMRVPLFVLTGGDPLKRPDLMPIVQYACGRGVPDFSDSQHHPATGAQRDIRSESQRIDASGAKPGWIHCGITRRISRRAGSYQRTLDAVEWCHEAGLPVQINTTMSRRNLADLNPMIELLKSLRIVLWSVFFLVPTGRAQQRDLLSPEQHEQVFAKLYQASKQVKFHIKTTEGQHYRRYVLQQKAKQPELPHRRQFDRDRSQWRQ